MKVTFTVLGYYEGNGQIFCDHVEAEDGVSALKAAAEAADEATGQRESLVLLAAICGKLKDRDTDIEHEEEEREPGVITFPGDSVVDCETYLTNFEED